MVLTDDTTTKDDKGLFGLDKQQMSNVVLIPGLKVDVDGTSDEQGPGCSENDHCRWRRPGNRRDDPGRLASHRTASRGQRTDAREHTRQHIAAHNVQLAANKENIEANQQNIAANQQKIEQNMKDIEENTNRFTALSEYDVKGEATVKFSSRQLQHLGGRTRKNSRSWRKPPLASQGTSSR